jgi:hypothetical protein
MSDAAKELNIDAGIISQNIKGKLHRAGKYRFTKHKDGLEKIPEGEKQFTRRVHQFDFYGNYIQTFDSCTEASRFINSGSTTSSSMIAKCAKGNRASYKGFLWSYERIPFVNNRRRLTRERKVNMYDLNNQYIRTFNSITEAKNHVNPGVKTCTSIIRCCKAERKTAYGYIWRYADIEGKLRV